MDSKEQDPKFVFFNDAEQFFSGKNFWQASLIQQLSGLTCGQALWRPSPERHCIWEYLRHMNYWKEWAIVYVKDNEKLNAKERNWEALPEIQNEENWQAEIEKAKLIHEHFTNVAEKLGNEIYVSAKENIAFFRQVLLHDSYHNGQIGLMKALQGIKSVE